ncbi:hypothetical protein KFU94_09185 [Chloroflexi bacterium TSY]|nr:hypothetical protein [Chloroflexi bacterium TSY]
MKQNRIQLHDPTAELSPVLRERRQPPSNLKGKTVALFDIGKTRSDEFLDHIERLLQAQGIQTARYTKPTNTRVAPT